jgi:hypothetical protein
MAYSQPGIFNALDPWGTNTFGMVAGDSSQHTARNNAAALQAAINAAQAAGNTGGGIVLIPSYSGTVNAPVYGPYYIDTSQLTGGTITIPTTTEAAPLLIMGTGTGTTLIMQTPSTTLFTITSDSFVSFQDLTIIDQAASETSSGRAFQFTGGSGTSEGYKLFRVNIQDFPTGVNVGNNGLFTNILECTISYSSAYNAANACNAINDTGTETNVEQCSLSYGATGGSANAIGINIVGSFYVRITDTQLSGFGTGINLGGTGRAVGASFTGVTVQSTGSCVNIVKAVYDACFVNCSFSPSSGSPAVAGVNIGTNDTNNADFDTIRFTACTVSGYGTYGILINVGQNIQINGGSFSGNGTAGIAIAGAVAVVQINGANCNGPAQSGTTQQYGVYITAGSEIQLNGVNCSGNGTSRTSGGAGIYVAGSVASPVFNLSITGAICDGYLGSGSSIQQYGISLQQVQHVVIDGCLLSENITNALILTSVSNVVVSACAINSGATGALGISVSGTSTSPTTDVYIRGCNGSQYAVFGSVVAIGSHVNVIEVTDCAGYNDTAAVLFNGTTIPSGSFGGSYYSYYGPIAFYLAATGNVDVKVDSQDTHLASGGFVLAPGEVAQIVPNTGTIVNLLVIGK